MNSLRKWLYRPKRTDQSLLAQFFFADEELNTVATELDSFDGRKDPDRCTALVNHLRQCQDKVLNICQLIMDEVIPEDRATRDFRAKFPDDVLQENLAGQLWFGAECLAAGSSILNRELESTTMRPLAKALTKSLENVRNLLREQCFRSPPEFTEKICESLKILDRLFAEFELSYVSAMVPVKSVMEYEAQQSITVLFSETLQRALGLSLLSQDQVDSCDPALMFTIPRLAIVAGLLIFPEGPLCLDRGELSDMFRPFRSLLLKIRELLWTLSRPELSALERALCSMEEPTLDASELIATDCKPSPEPPVDVSSENGYLDDHDRCKHRTTDRVNEFGVPHTSINGQPGILDYLDQFYKDFPDCKQFISDLVCHNTDRESPPSSVESTSEADLVDPTGSRRHLDIHLLVNAMAVAHANVAGLQNSTCSQDSESITGNAPEMGNNCLNICDNEEPAANNGDLPVEKQSSHDNLEEVPMDGRYNRDQDNVCDEIASTNTPVHGRPERPRELKCGDGGKSIAFTSGQDETTTPIAEVKVESLVETPHCSKLHSSSSSQDSGLSSMADCEKLPSPSVIIDSDIKPSVAGSSGSIGSSKSLSNANTGGTGTGCNSLKPQSSKHKAAHTYCDSGATERSEMACELSSFEIECQDDIEIALAMQAAEIATRNEARSRFKNSADLIHRLFICISGVADQLQTNYAADLRSTLKCVFAMNATPCEETPSLSGGGSSNNEVDLTPEPSLDEDMQEQSYSEDQPCQNIEPNNQQPNTIHPPSWVPDELAPQCMGCVATFTVVRRRHHCRNCGKVFCGKCSGNSVPLPRYGHVKPVRVCNRCYMYCVTPFTLPSSPQH